MKFEDSRMKQTFILNTPRFLSPEGVKVPFLLFYICPETTGRAAQRKPMRWGLIEVGSTIEGIGLVYRKKGMCDKTSSFVATIVKFTQLCSKFLPTALLNFACDWLALDTDISFGRLTSHV